jgi:hypothetical protein
MQVKEKERNGTQTCDCVFGRRTFFQSSKLSFDEHLQGPWSSGMLETAQWACSRQWSSFSSFVINQGESTGSTHSLEGEDMLP